MAKPVTLLFCFLASAISGFSQWGASVACQRGFLLPHHANMRHLPNHAAQALEFRLAHQTNGCKAWHKLYKEPSIDFTLKYFNLGNEEILGFGIGTAAIYSKPIFKSNHFYWNLEIGAGSGFISKPFDLRTNYRNNAIGSKINAFILLGTQAEYRLSKMLVVNGSLSFNHFSNAAFTPVNLGLNYPMASLGFAIKPEFKVKCETPIDSLIKQPNFWQWSISSGLKHNNVNREKIYPTISLNADRVFGLSLKSSVSSGIDVFYNASLLDGKRENGQNASALANIQFGIHGIYNLNIDRMMIMAGIGAYVIDQNKKDGIIYNRFGIRYYLTEHFGVNLSIKTHLFTADYFELGIAHKF